MLKVVGASWVQTRISWCLLISISLLGVVALYLGPSYSVEPDGKYAATVYYGKESKFRLEYWGQNNDPADIKPGVARGFYQPDIFKTGWATLEIETQESYPDNLQACAAGMLEGALSWQMILHHWQNTIQKTCVARQEFCARTREFLTRNAEEVRRKAEHADAADPFWHQVNLFYSQLEGLAQGWRSGIKRSRRDNNIEIPWIDFLWMNVMPDLRDLERRFNGTADFNPHRPPLSFIMLKYFPTDPSNFILAHGSSGTYNSMLRIQKRYSFAYHDTGDDDSDPVNGRVVTFSSYPGTIFSGDDFYQIRSTTGEHLTVVGTELKNNNQTTWSYEEETTVLMGPRVMAANRLSRDADDWASLFTRRNSGTGNKHWLILDTSENFTAWAVEQMPGLTHAQEVTQRIVEDRHWIACGIPYFQDTLAQSEGYGEGSSLYHLKNLNPLYIALKKYVHTITTVASVVEVMRSYEISIIGRSDLNGNSNLYGYLNVTASMSKHHEHHHRHGGEDVEATARTVGEEIAERDEMKGRTEKGSSDMPSVLSGIHRTEADSNDLLVASQIPLSHGLLEAIAQNALPKSLDVRLDRSRMPAKQADFHSAHYYEHRNMPDRILVNKASSVGSSEVDKSADATGTPYNHKYAGVYRKLENGLKRPRDVSERLWQLERDSFRDTDVNDSSNRLERDSSEMSLNSSSGDSSDSKDTLSTSSNSGDSVSTNSDAADGQTSVSTNSQRSPVDNQTSVTQRSHSFSSTSSSNTIQPGSLPSVDKSDSYSSETNQLPALEVPGHKDSKIIETKVTPNESQSSSTVDVSLYGPSDFKPDNSQTEKPLETTTKVTVVHSAATELPPTINIHFHSSKHLLHSKPNVDTKTNMGARFLNSSKQFRGIIDVKIARGNSDFIAISGPPYVRSKFQSTGNRTMNSTELGAGKGNVEPFQWSTSNIRHQKHTGHPDLWNFDVFKASWVWS